MRTSFLILTLIASSLATAPVSAQGAVTSSDKRARQVIDDALVALGGERFLNMEDRVESGRAYSFYHDRLSGLSIAKIYTRYISVAPAESGKMLATRERQEFGKNADTAAVFREEGAANINWRGTKPMPPDQFGRYRDSMLRNIFYILRVRLKEPGLTFESRGTEVVDYMPVEAVEIFDSENRSVKVYFHQTTKLPVKQVFEWRDQSKELNEEVTRFARYRENNGIQWPQQITRERNGDKIYQIFAESVQFNTDLTDDLFSLTGVTRKK
ncbi:MAG: hypothetical protein ABL967_18640 [Bryobacteraceae bacterium]